MPEEDHTSSERDTWSSNMSAVTFYSLDEDGQQSFKTSSSHRPLNTKTTETTTRPPYVLTIRLPPRIALPEESQQLSTTFYKTSSSLPDWLYCFTFATRYEIILYCLGIVAALVSGVGFMGLTLLYGSWGNAVNDGDADVTKSKALITLCGALGIAGGVFITYFSFFYLLSFAARRICTKMRCAYFDHIMHQDALYFQNQGSGEIVSRMITDINTIEKALGEKAGFSFWTLGILISAFTSAMAKNIKLAGFLFVPAVLFVVLLRVSNYFSSKTSDQLIQIEGRANSYAERILTHVRTVQAFSAENFVYTTYAEQYQSLLTEYGFFKVLNSAFEFSGMYISISAIHPMAFWFGARQVFNEDINIGALTVPYYNCLDAFFASITLFPHFQTLLESIALVKNVKAEMMKKPSVDVRNLIGITLFEDDKETLSSYSIIFNDVSFAYPQSPHVDVLSRLSFVIPAGKTTAIVGESGAGKSTITSLLLREYAALDQTIFFAHHDLNSYNLQWLRSQFAVVTQEPQLLTGTIWENVAHGLAGTSWEHYIDNNESEYVNKNKDDELKEKSYYSLKHERIRIVKRMCREALILADAIDFVETLPDGIDTIISHGLRLSGGQKQRIALARALVRRPRVLILDEATSALDYATEKRIKENLEREQARRHMTMIIIAHRITTVENADNILVMQKGKIIEEGTHRSLISLNGLYKELAQKQDLSINTTPLNGEKANNASYEALIKESRNIEQQRRLSRRLSTDYYKNRRSSLNVVSSVFDCKGNHKKRHSYEDVDDEDALPNRRFIVNTFQKFIFPLKNKLFIALAASFIVGAMYTIWAYMIGKTIQIIGHHKPGYSSPNLSDVTPWLIYFTVALVIMPTAGFISAFAFEYVACQLNSKIRSGVIKNLLQQEPTFHDKTSPGALVASLNSSASNISQIFGLTAVNIIITVANLLGPIIFVGTASWKLLLVGFGPLLTLILTGYIQTYAFEESENQRQPILDEMASVSNELIDSIRTTRLFGRQNQVVKLFEKIARKSTPAENRLLCLGSVGFAASQSISIICCGITLWWSAQLLVQNEVQENILFSSYECTLLSTFSAATVAAYLPDFARAIKSLSITGMWSSRESTLQPISRMRHLTHNYTTEDQYALVYENVNFRYPIRPDVLALQNLDLKIKTGQRVAFVGQSGSGKSTAMQLLLRMYDTVSGRIFIDGNDIKSYTLHELRSHMAFVPQDSVLFEGTLRENICFGLENINDNDVWEACRSANLLEMIKELPLKLDTKVGIKGDDFSGGQKQRLAIARAILRKPRILLLDEATSALDSNSEAAVQSALRNISVGRTTITIAHRLSTIYDSDLICVFNDGKIVEKGTHESLLSARSFYYKLVHSQH